MRIFETSKEWKEFTSKFDIIERTMIPNATPAGNIINQVNEILNDYFIRYGEYLVVDTIKRKDHPINEIWVIKAKSGKAEHYDPRLDNKYDTAIYIIF